MIRVTQPPRFGPKTEDLMISVLRSGYISQGKYVEQLENGFASLIGAKHAIAVSSGTAALTAALQVAGVGYRDDVVTSAFTFPGTINAILATGATVSFADIGDDFNLAPDALASVINDQTRAIVPIHLYGQCADMDPILRICGASDIELIEDAAQAHLAVYNGVSAGSFGFGCFSLYATKALTTGEGGFVVTADDAAAEQLRIVRNQGMSTQYEFGAVGQNWRMTDVHAVLAIEQLERIGDDVTRRRANAHALSSQLDGLDGLILPRELPGRVHTWHQYTVRLDKSARLNRNELRDEMLRRGIESRVYYPRVAFAYDCYVNHERVKTSHCPNATAAASEVLSLPIHPGISESQITQIAEAVEQCLS